MAGFIFLLAACAKPVFSPSAPQATPPPFPSPTETAPAVPAPSAPAEEWTLVAVGDISFARKIARYIEQNGLDYPLAKVTAYLKSADLAFANLESPISDRGTPLPNKGIWFRAKPETIQCLTDAGIDVVNLANNHILDYDQPAFQDTMTALRQHGIGFCGAGQNLADARKPYIVDQNGTKVAFLGYSELAEIFWVWSDPKPFVATDQRPGVAPLHVDKILEDIAAAKQQADIVVVTLHWGVEYTDIPTEEQRKIAHRIIDGGADVILGGHPHVTQGFEVYKGKLIAYSLGNFVFDQTHRPNTESVILELAVAEKTVKKALIHPAYIVDGQPYVPTGEERDFIFARLQKISRPLGTDFPPPEGGVLRLALGEKEQR